MCYTSDSQTSWTTTKMRPTSPSASPRWRLFNFTTNFTPKAFWVKLLPVLLLLQCLRQSFVTITKNVFSVLSDDWQGTHENIAFSLLYPIFSLKVFRIFALQLMPLLVFHSSCPFHLWDRKISIALKSNRQKPFRQLLGILLSTRFFFF